jgi:hypothetical protein
VQKVLGDPAFLMSRYDRGTIDTRDTSTTRLHKLLGKIFTVTFPLLHVLLADNIVTFLKGDNFTNQQHLFISIAQMLFSAASAFGR